MRDNVWSGTADAEELLDITVQSVLMTTLRSPLAAC